MFRNTVSVPSSTGGEVCVIPRRQFINKDITSIPTYILSQISKHSFPVVGLKPVSTTEIINTIIPLKEINSHGYEEVSIQLLKISAPCICSPLTYVCN